LKLYLLLAVCIAPVVASYLAYYVFPPSGRTNYGDLIDPQRPVPPMQTRLLHRAEDRAGGQGEAANGAADEGLAAFSGQWVLVAVDSGACELECAKKLFFMRQTHASLGKERDRVARVLLVTDSKPLPDKVLGAHPNLTVLRAGPDELARLFPVASDTGLTDHVYVIDPLQNLMMRFPRDPDPTRTRKDLQKLLRASRIG
jgi:hypothetical protein